METMIIKLPRSMKSFVEERVKSREHHNASAYIRKLIREDRTRKAQEDL